MSNSEPMIIAIPRPEKAIDKNRPINTLLQWQVRHFLDIEHKQLIPSHRTGETKDLTPMSEEEIQNYLKSWTEGQAADYIRKMTAKLHELKTKPKKKRARKTTAKRKTRASS